MENSLNKFKVVSLWKKITESDENIRLVGQNSPTDDETNSEKKMLANYLWLFEPLEQMNSTIFRNNFR